MFAHTVKHSATIKKHEMEVSALIQGDSQCILLLLLLFRERKHKQGRGAGGRERERETERERDRETENISSRLHTQCRA